MGYLAPTGKILLFTARTGTASTGRKIGLKRGLLHVTSAEVQLYLRGMSSSESAAGRASLRTLRMPKALCLSGMVVAILIALLFLTDLVASLIAPSFAPFRGVSMFMDIALVACAAVLGAMSWLTFREQV